MAGGNTEGNEHQDYGIAPAPGALPPKDPARGVIREIIGVKGEASTRSEQNKIGSPQSGPEYAESPAQDQALIDRTRAKPSRDTPRPEVKIDRTRGDTTRGISR